MMIAPSAAFGNDSSKGVKNAIVTRTTPAVTIEAKGVVVYSRAGEPARDRVPTEDTGGHVRGAKPDQLPVRINLVLMTAGIGLGNRDGLHEPNQGDHDRCHRKVADKRTIDVREAKSRQGIGDVADNFDPTRVEVEKFYCKN